MSKQKIKLFTDNFSELPEKIRVHLKGVISENFIYALKTTYKPNETIPILWLVIYQGGIVFCNTHKTRGVYKLFSYKDIDSIKIYPKTEFVDFKVEILMSGLNEDNFQFSIPSDIDIEKLKHILKKMNYQVLQ